MRDRVFRAADSVCASVPAGACDLYILLPENPAYFWRERTAPALRDIPGLTVKHNVYTVLHDSAQDGYVSRYLAQAERSGARAVIAACTPTAAERAQLAALAQRGLVILLSEDADVPNAFYVGSDARQDGAEIGRRFAQDGGAGLPVILTAPDNKNCTAREQGFLAAAGEAAAGAVTLPLPLYGKLFPAKTAALLSALPPAPECARRDGAGRRAAVCRRRRAGAGIPAYRAVSGAKAHDHPLDAYLVDRVLYRAEVTGRALAGAGAADKSIASAA